LKTHHSTNFTSSVFTWIQIVAFAALGTCANGYRQI